MVDKEATKSEPASTNSQGQTNHSRNPVCSVTSDDQTDTLTNETWKQRMCGLVECRK